MRAVPMALQCGPDPITGWPRLDLALDDGSVVSVVLDPAHARALARRVDAIVCGSIVAMPASRRVLEIDLAACDGAPDTGRVAAGGGIR